MKAAIRMLGSTRLHFQMSVSVSVLSIRAVHMLSEAVICVMVQSIKAACQTIPLNCSVVLLCTITLIRIYIVNACRTCSKLTSMVIR